MALTNAFPNPPIHPAHGPGGAVSRRISSASNGKFSGKFSETFPGQGALSVQEEVLSYRHFFALRWQRFVNENFTSPEHAALVFGVDGSTAKKWFDGSHAPSGFAVGYAYERFPNEARAALQAAA